MYQNEPALLNVSFKKSRAGIFIATVRILTKNQVKWRRVSGRINTKKNELFYQAISLIYLERLSRSISD